MAGPRAAPPSRVLSHRWEWHARQRRRLRKRRHGRIQPIAARAVALHSLPFLLFRLGLFLFWADGNVDAALVVPRGRRRLGRRQRARRFCARLVSLGPQPA